MEKIRIVAQAFYGNRTTTEVIIEELDAFICGCLSMKHWNFFKEKVDRTYVQIPGAHNLVIVYNKYQEEAEIERKNQVFEKEGYELKPLATIPELGLDIYSRCIVCRRNENGELKSIEAEDWKMFEKYLSN